MSWIKDYLPVRAGRAIKSNCISAMRLSGKVQVSCLPSVLAVPEVALGNVHITRGKCFCLLSASACVFCRRTTNAFIKIQNKYKREINERE